MRDVGHNLSHDTPSANASDRQRTAVECLDRPSGLTRHTGRLKTVLALTAVFMVVEVVGGLVSHSLVLLADAGHMLTDAASLGLALFAAWIAGRPPTAQKTFGYLRYEILAALVNGAALFVVAGLIVWEAVRRFAAPTAVQWPVLLGVATLGLVVNVVALRILHGGHHDSLNVRGAYLHVLGDLLGSVGALVAGGVIALTGWVAVDPAVSIGIALLILGGAWRLVRESVDVLLEATPGHIELDDVARRITTIEGVTDVHDLHVWTVTSGMVAMSGHAVVPNAESGQRVIETVQDRMAAIGIHHVTVQIEDRTGCPGRGSDV